MQHLLRKYEEEKCKLNQLGQASIDQGIPLSSNEAVQAQSRKVDELVNLMYREKSEHAGTFSFDHYLGGDRMSFPSWFLQAMQGRLDEVSAQIENQSELEQVFEKESKAFKTLFASLDLARMPEFIDWEDKFHSKQAILYERLYLQGFKDGMQLVNSLSYTSVLADKDVSCKAGQKSM
ncbi:hypothetical protein [Paenibacillus tengchongensis]|uniref:hypothetical protein n=1 Tax=Paenibacillus tengchongensis TaxID=2608684 RepID=UPI00124F52D7|nr:hypothetical protein [Paenibacillus tengchongensis]